MVVLSNPILALVNVAVKNIAGRWSVEWHVQMSAALGRLFMRGLLAGALKG